MELLAGSDVRAILGLLERLGESADVDGFAALLTTGIRELVGCDLASYNEVDPARGHALFRCDPAEAVFPGAQERFVEHVGEHPLVSYYHRTGDGRALKLSDFVSVRQFHATALHHEVFQPIATNHLLSVNFETATAGGMVALALHRERPDFTERHRTLLDALRPHLALAYQAAQARQMLAQAEGVLDREGRHVLLAAPDGTVHHATPGALACLARHDGLASAQGMLPESVRRLLQPPNGRPRDSLVIRNAASPLLVRVLDRSPARVVLLLDEPAAAGRITALETWGLTSREGEVLRLVADGLTNRQVAVRLHVSVPTVKSHLQHIYDKLGVHTRTAAVTVVRNAQNA